MKKFIVLVSAALLSMGIASAQDFEKATNMAKEANEALVNGDFQTAADTFKAALQETEGCTEEGVDVLVASCKKGYVLAQNGYAQALYKKGELDAAIAQAEVTIAAAKENGEDEIAQKAESFKFQLHQAVANAKMKAAGAAADAAGKAAAYKEALVHLEAVLEKDAENGKAYLQKGQILNALGKKDDAIAAFTKASELGLGDQANKQLSTIFLKEAQALNKAQNFKGAVEAALKSAEYLPNANAYKIAGIASQKAGDIAGAAEYLQKYLDINPGAADAAQMKAAVEAFKAQLKK